MVITNLIIVHLSNFRRKQKSKVLDQINISKENAVIPLKSNNGILDSREPKLHCDRFCIRIPVCKMEGIDNRLSERFSWRGKKPDSFMKGHPISVLTTNCPHGLRNLSRLFLSSYSLLGKDDGKQHD